MDTQTRFELIKEVGEEVITENELREIVESKQHPIAYDGFEPSGLGHLPFGIFRPLLLKDLTKAGVHFKLWIADWFGWINNKMGGDLEAIKRVGDYFIEVWKAGGLDPKKVEFIFASDKLKDPEYWRRFVLIGKNTTMSRATRALNIMGRTEGEMKEVAQYFYPIMQANDIFQLDVDIAQLGLDQRRACMLARDIAPKLNLKKPVAVSHHMLMGLQGVKQPDGLEDDKGMDIKISSKMSKSKPESSVFVHDSAKDIKRKINTAFCAPKDIQNNPMLDYAKHIIFRAYTDMTIDRHAKFGGAITFSSYEELEAMFRKGELHPADLKAGVARYIDLMVAPIRQHFEKNAKAKRLYEFVKKQEVTR